MAKDHSDAATRGNEESTDMSVRMAIAKLSAAVAGGALIGGGAVHVAEPPARNPQYVKHVKQPKARRVVKRTVRLTVTPARG